MAPSCPEEVDVFTVPHSRMKELVCKYLDMLTATNFSNVGHLTKLLENLIKTFQEFIAHEQIENQYIMKKLKNKLRSLSIQNTAVCNCHKDNMLLDMLKFFQDGYKCTKKSDLDRHNYGLQLKRALENFTETFLPHMEEEEEVFQPLLMQHFTFEELKQIKATVIQQHFKAESEEIPEKCVADVISCKSEVEVAEKVNCVKDIGIENLPDEVLLKVFSHLNPQDLCRSAQVSRRWNRLSMDGALWTELYPVSWAKGDWNAKCGVNEEELISVDERLSSKAFDEDADVDEADDWDEEAREIQHQSAMLTLMCKHLLPRVGRTVRHCDLAYSKGLTNGTLYKILSLCPNLEYLDLTQTRVSDLGFKGFQKSNCGQMLRYLDLSGCLYITDLTLQRLSSALGGRTCHMTETEEPLVDTSCQVTEPANEEEGCSICNENRKNEEQNREKCMKNEAKERSGGKNKTSSCKNGQGQFVGSYGEQRNQASHGEDRVEGCRTRKCCDTGTSCAAKSRKHPGCRCCHGNVEEKEKFPDQSDSNIVEHWSNEDALDAHLDDGNKDSQDRSWIKQSSTSLVQSSRLGTDHSLGNKVIPEANTNEHRNHREKCDDEPGIRTKADRLKSNILVQVDCNTNDQIPEHGNDKIIDDTLPGQTFLPDFILQALFPEQHNATPKKTDNTKEDNVTVVNVGDTGDRVGIPVGQHGPPVRQDNWSRSLEFLSLSGCYQITDTGLNYLADIGRLPRLQYLDLSGCLNLTGEAVSRLVSMTPHLNPENLFYCDNILDGPFADVASGCQNLQCGSRVCCRCGE